MHELQIHLNLLENLGLLDPSFDAEHDYRFHHALVQDAAYSSLLRQDRQQIHESVARAIEKLAPERRDELAAVLAHHYAEAGNFPRALEYMMRAAERAFKQNALSEAIVLYERSMSLAHTAAAADEISRIILLGHGRALELLNRYEEALTLYRTLEHVAVRSSSTLLQTTALLARATLHNTPTSVVDFRMGRMLATQALELARESNDHEAESKALWNLMLNGIYSGGDYQQATRSGEQALVVAERYGLTEQAAYILGDLSIPYWMIGRIEEAISSRAKAIARWQQLGNLQMQADCQASLAHMLMLTGNYDGALQYFTEADDASQRSGSDWGRSNSRLTIHHVFAERGQLERAIASLEQGIWFSGRSKNISGQLFLQSDLALMFCEVGAYQQALAFGQQALSRVSGQAPHLQGWPLSVLLLIAIQVDQQQQAHGYAEQLSSLGDRGAILVAPVLKAHALLSYWNWCGEPAQTLRAYEAARPLLELRQLRYRSSDIQHQRALALLMGGDEAAATAGLERAEAIARELGSARSLWRILDDRAELLAAQGQHAKAAACTAEAITIVERLAKGLDEALRVQFLSQPQVLRLRKRARP